ncbi:MAG: HAMP domain-containing sensor histidine kinase [Peptostreptococcaceae bacterium]
MADKLIYIINLSFLIADVFCIIACIGKINKNIILSTFLLFSINFINFKNLYFLYIISIIFNLILICIINYYNFKNDKYRVIKMIGILVLVTVIIILKIELKYLNLFINITGCIYILNESFKKVIQLTEEKNKSIYNDLKCIKYKANSGNKLLKSNENDTKKLSNILSNKKELLNIILEQNSKCVILVDKYGYISSEDCSFTKTWKEYEYCNYKIKFSHFLNKSILNNTEVLIDTQKVYDIGIEIDREVISKDNRYFDCKLTPLKVNDENIGVICIMTDITYKKYSQKILDYNKVKYKKTIETIPHAIVVTKNEEVVYNNNKNLEIDIYDEKLKKFIIDTKVNSSFEGKINEGEKKYLNIRKTSFEENNMTKEIAILRDITDYKTLLNNIEKSAKKHSSLVNAIPQGIYIYDFESMQTVYTNDVLLNMSGYENIEEFNKSHIIKDITWVLNKFGQDVKFIRHRIQNKIGNNIDVELGGITLEINNKMKCIGIMNDITEKVKAEKIEREIIKKKLEYKQKNHFFINMSHELKTPLNLIMSTNQLMQSIFKNEISNKPNEELARSVRVVENQSYISLRLIENIITLTKLESDFYSPKLDYYDIINVVEDIIIEVNKYSKKDGVEFIFDTNVEEKVVNIDPYDIERVMLLLFSKVIKQSRQKSIIFVDFIDKCGCIEIFIKNIGGYDKDICLKEQSRENIQMNLEVAKSIMKIYGGNINIIEVHGDIEISISLNVENETNHSEKKVSIVNKESIYAEYSMINAL